VRVRDAARGIVEVPVIDWALNSMGAMQGGVVATVADAAAEAALRAATGRSLVVTDLYITYLGFGRVGPVRSQVEVLGASAAHGAARVELVDAGAENRQMTVVHAVATEGPA
jgi:acyl-coenzyme A thioesterase PaaI-like protein